MALAKVADGFIRITAQSKIPDDPFFIFSALRRVREPKIPKVYPVFAVIEPNIYNDIFYRTANPQDLNVIREFTDYWLSGKGYAAGAQGAGHDYFIPSGQHKDYLKFYTTLLAFAQSKVIGWAVRQRDGTLIHLLVASDWRGKGIGAHLLKTLEPKSVRSKSDQSTGDPLNFYLKHGFAKTSDQKIGKHQNIDVLVSADSKKIP
jgi:GNAT superfamily N-acetyltransferase